MASHPSLSQECHAIHGLLLLKHEDHSAPPPCLIQQSEAPINNVSQLVTPPKGHTPTNAGAVSRPYDPASILRDTPPRTPIINPKINSAYTDHGTERTDCKEQGFSFKTSMHEQSARAEGFYKFMKIRTGIAVHL